MENEDNRRTDKMNELTLRVKQNPGTIELNFAELNQQMDEKLAEYKRKILRRGSLPHFAS